jgi:hypothetical protein
MHNGPSEITSDQWFTGITNWTDTDKTKFKVVSKRGGGWTDFLLFGV